MKKNCFYPADILLPSFSKDPEKMKTWACVACDQYTSEPEYWDRCRKTVGDAPSALNLILPELYLSEADARIGKIGAAMEEYLTNGVLTEHKNSMIYLERRLASTGKLRRGIVGAVDLECYDYNKGANSLIRATEGTVTSRIPPRVKIREGAKIELPHIMILIDDPEKTVIEPLAKADDLEVAYDFDLMCGGGHVVGKFVSRDKMRQIDTALDKLCDRSPMLFAMGDGNHSLASAKAFWEKIKPTLSDEEKRDHPARFALAEIVNIHDEALEFEPIYRVVFGVDPEKLLADFRNYASKLPHSGYDAQSFDYIFAGGKGRITVENPTAFLPVGTLQTFLDKYIEENKDAEIDYIHGIDSTEKLAGGKNAVGFIFRGMEKDDLFKTVICDGALPRKTFSMGEADDKRFYLEARKIVRE